VRERREGVKSMDKRIGSGLIVIGIGLIIVGFGVLVPSVILISSALGGVSTVGLLGSSISLFIGIGVILSGVGVALVGRGLRT
jgi:hypothetical protein